MKRVTIIVTQIDKSVAFEWMAEKVDAQRFELSYILLNSQPSYLHQYLQQRGIPSREFFFKSKKDFPRLFFQIWKTLREWKTEVVHTHQEEAGLLGLTVAKILGIRRRIYTRHNATYHLRYQPKGLKIDRAINWLATDVIAITERVRQILVKYDGCPDSKITLLHHGFDLSAFKTVPPEQVADLARKYNPAARRPVVGVVARYMHWKGIQHIIPAFKNLLKNYPDAFLILANAKSGDYASEIREMLKILPAESFVEIEYEYNNFALYKLFDVFVHAPIDEELEAFGQIYVETMAAGVPMVCTMSGIAHEIVEDGRNAFVVPHQNSEAIERGILQVLADSDLRQRLILGGFQTAEGAFGVDEMVRKHEVLYAK